MTHVWKEISQVRCLLARDAIINCIDPTGISSLKRGFPQCFTENDYTLEECGQISWAALSLQVERDFRLETDYEIQEYKFNFEKTPKHWATYFRLLEFDRARYNSEGEHVMGRSFIPRNLLIGFLRQCADRESLSKHKIESFELLSRDIVDQIIDHRDNSFGNPGTFTFMEQEFLPLQIFPHGIMTDASTLVECQEAYVVAIPSMFIER